MKIVLVRHGTVLEEFVGKYNGHNAVALSRKGKEQMKSLALAMQTRSFDAVFCSDLLRARESIEPFCFEDVIFTPALREKSWGRHEGLSFDELQEQGLVYEDFGQWIALLDGERYSLYKKRVLTFFEALFQKDFKEVFVMTHAGVIRTFFAEMTKVSLEESFALALEYGSVVEYDTKERSFRTIKYNVG
jgi:broad specificity phosphatase PhoE